ncbi:tryptophan synthase subunit alpha [Helicobacter sp. MIT 14-3879]|uniref:tryptophan synthase subunit alpha n=1 Tax=Helicobacter sp. MIT 14-3879 TaxID=2040649 RepID=UPI0015F1453D|nr:tryptophan synthase subunit alpha [Helicobacter sp. MIT 14-3879]
MSNIYKAFSNGKAFIPFITCGDPTLEVTEKIIYEMVENGADLIELGIPFSDPIAEGIVIQSANKRALENGVTTDKIFCMLESVRKKTSIPIVFMTYANVIFSYGREDFMKNANSLLIDGIILPDVPYEEKNEFESFCKKYNMDIISFIAPTSKNRIHTIAQNASGFLYCVSSLGVTGIRDNISTNILDIINVAKRSTKIPIAVGFGIKTPLQAKQVSKYADGVIVGSAIVKLCEKYGNDCIKHIGLYIREMKSAII